MSSKSSRKRPVGPAPPRAERADHGHLRVPPAVALQPPAGNPAIGRPLGGRAGEEPRAQSEAAAGLSGSGRPLEPAVRAQMEATLGHDFGDVRVHTDDAAARAAESLDARAFTLGSRIAFGESFYAPGTGEG